MKTHFDAILGELETLTKAMPMKGDDDEADPKIAAAAADGGPDDGDDEEGDDEGAAPPQKKKGKPFGKSLTGTSMTVTLEDGTEVEAEDGTALVKSLTESLGALTERQEESDTALAKAFGGFMTLLKAQGSQLATIQTQMKAIAGEGRGRKAVVNLLDKPNAGGGSDAGGINPDEVMAKATSMFEQGKLLGQDLTYIETSFNRGNFALPAKLLSKIVGSAA
jgi:hypothetical protein